MYTHTGPELMGGGALGRQISIQLTPEQFEKLYLQPGESRRHSRPPEVADEGQLAEMQAASVHRDKKILQNVCTSGVDVKCRSGC